MRKLEGDFAGEIFEIIDGVGRCYQLELIRIKPRINMQGWGQDNGIRIHTINLKLDPTRETLPKLPTVKTSVYRPPC